LSFRSKFINKIFNYFIIVICLPLIGCQFTPVYKNNNIIPELCAIDVKNEKNSAPLYEIKFKNELQYILCGSNNSNIKYELNWEIVRNYRELIKSESNYTRRYEETFLVNFSISNIENNNIIYSDSVTSKGAYNMLEDEIVSTIASKNSVIYHIATNAAGLVLDKIYLFMSKK
jgi:hypothetical protein